MPGRSRKRPAGSGNGRNIGASASTGWRPSSNATTHWIGTRRRQTMVEAATAIRVPVEKIAPDTIRLERTLDAPAEMVWRYLTEAELRSQWFMGGTDATGVGAFDLLVDHDKLSDDANVPYPESYKEFKGATWTE